MLTLLLIHIKISPSTLPSDVREESLRKLSDQKSRRSLKNAENKARMIELVVRVIKRNAVKVLTLLNSEEIFISTDNDCSKITAESVDTEHKLVSNQEEADTKVVLHSIHALNRDQVRNIIVRSPSGDIDIIVIMIGLLLDKQTRCFLDTGSGNNRKGLWLSNVDISEDMEASFDRVSFLHRK